MQLIFDTDMGNDIDDALALALIHALEIRKECKLLAVTLTNDQRDAAPFVDLVNTFYGRSNIPIGVVRDGAKGDDNQYTTKVVTKKNEKGDLLFPHGLKSGDDAPEATGLLRKTLAAAEDGSVVIVQVGFSTNLARLLDSEADDFSPLDGKALVARKVRFLSAMAGSFGEGEFGPGFHEYNVVTDLPSARKVFHEWPTPVLMSGFEIGNAILYPAQSILNDYRYVEHHPIAEAYAAYMKMPHDRPSWDLTAVLAAVRPDQGYFGLSPVGVVHVDDEGVTSFEVGENGTRRYLTVTPEQIIRVRETFVDLCSQPNLIIYYFS